MSAGGKRGGLSASARPDLFPAELAEHARRACLASRRTTSGLPRGAALLTSRGVIVAAPQTDDPANSGAAVCAERMAIYQAVLAGHRRFRALMIRGGVAGRGKGGPPCGACLQVLAEFSPNTRIWWGTARHPEGGFSVGDLLPDAFRGRALRAERTRSRSTGRRP